MLKDVRLLTVFYLTRKRLQTLTARSCIYLLLLFYIILRYSLTIRGLTLFIKMGIVRFALKSSVAGGTVYWTVQQGVWSSPEETMNAYCKLYNNVAPLIQKNISPDVAKELSELPSFSTMTNCAKGMWNRGVITSIKYLSELPTHVSNGIDYVTQMATSATSNETVPAVKGMFKTPPESNKAQ